MGVALWLLCGVAGFAASRAIRPARPEGWAGELIGALVVSFAAGLASTALDFGGWNEVDWRAGAFAVLCAFSVIGAVRTVRLLT